MLVYLFVQSNRLTNCHESLSCFDLFLIATVALFPRLLKLIFFKKIEKHFKNIFFF